MKRVCEFSNIAIICAEAEKNSLAFLEALVKCETTDCNEDAGQEILLSRLHDLPCKIDRFSPDPKMLSEKYPEFNSGHTYENRTNVVAAFTGSGGGRSLILNGHMDTVSPGERSKWRSDPFAPRLENGRLYGLGSADMKSGLAAMVCALEILFKNGYRPKGDILFQSVVDEEAGGGNGTLACIDRGYRADAALIAEPTSLQVMSAQAGSVAMRFRFAGKGSHSNLKWEGVNAFEKSLPFLNGLRKLEKEWQAAYQGDLLPAPIISINSVRAGDGGVVTPAECIAEINFTYNPENAETCKREILDTLQRSIENDPWFLEHPVEHALIHDCPPFYQDPANAWPAAMQCYTQEALQTQRSIGGLPCGSDGRLFANVADIPVVIVGPGDIRNAHAPNEFVPIDEFYNAVKLFAWTIVNWVW